MSFVMGERGDRRGFGREWGGMMAGEGLSLPRDEGCRCDVDDPRVRLHTYTRRRKL